VTDLEQIRAKAAEKGLDFLLIGGLAVIEHVLKQGKIHRFLDDLMDVVELVKVNRLDLRDAEPHDLFLKYGSAEIYEKVLRLLKAG